MIIIPLEPTAEKQYQNYYPHTYASLLPLQNEITKHKLSKAINEHKDKGNRTAKHSNHNNHIKYNGMNTKTNNTKQSKSKAKQNKQNINTTNSNITQQKHNKT